MSFLIPYIVLIESRIRLVRRAAARLAPPAPARLRAAVVHPAARPRRARRDV